MATRKKPETQPILDSHTDADKLGTVYTMELNQFNRVVRLVKTASSNRVAQLQGITKQALERIRVSRDSTKSVVGTPDGSDQVNIQNFVVWAQAIPRRGARVAVRQLVSIDATIASRLGG